MTKVDFDDLPYKVKVEMVAHWEINQEIAEYYQQKAETEAKEKERRYL